MTPALADIARRLGALRAFVTRLARLYASPGAGRACMRVADAATKEKP